MSYALDPAEGRFLSRATRVRQELAAAQDRIEELELQLDEAEQLLAHAEGLLGEIGILTRGYDPEREVQS